MKFALTGHASRTFVFGLTPASNPNCSVKSSATTCTLSLQLDAGTYAMNVTTYDAPPSGNTFPGSAKVVATAQNVPAKIRAGKLNTIDVSVDGVPASFSITGVPNATAGTAFVSPQAFTVVAKDAGGATIVGTYGNPVMVSSSDVYKAATIATSGADSPPAGELMSSSDTAKLNYTGLSIVPATITASATGASNATATFTPSLQPINFTGSDTLNASFTGVDLYATNSTGSSEAFTATEAGWTNAPFSRNIKVNGTCAFATVAPTEGTSFTATIKSNPYGYGTNECALTLTGGGQSLQLPMYFTIYNWTNAEQTIVVPANVTHMTITAAGGQGGAGIAGTTSGGNGGAITATVPVTPAETLALYVASLGGEGWMIADHSDQSPVRGYNGGGGTGASVTTGGAGGGASDVREGGTALANRIIVGGGGGGGGSPSSGANGGNGGNIAGAGGTASGGTPGTGGYGADTTPEGGQAGTDYGSCISDPQAGQLGVGGSLLSGCTVGGGAGGGGYYGGGAGGSGGTGGGGGGGGTSWVENTATNVTYSDGSHQNNGVIVLIF
ncbi:MAG TPA: glycine-rich protein [Candidatus Baltobacteraceae bacterium]